MKLQARTMAALLGGAAMALGLAASPALAQGANEQFIPHLVYRTGPYAPNGIPFADGVADYYKMINERDGGINGVKIAFEECDTGYNTDRGVECYERLKNKGATGAAGVIPLSTGITYALIERSYADKIPVFSSGYGRADASDGRVFPYVFTLPATYWTGADAAVTYIGQQMGGVDKLKGKKLAFVYHDSAFGKEPLPLLEALKNKYGFELKTFPVAPPGLEQKATWLQIGRQYRPDYTIMWGWGVQNSTAIKEAAAVGYPMEKLVGVWWAGSEQDVVPTGDAAKGYKAIAFHAPGAEYKVIRDIKQHVHGKGQASGDGSHIGTVLYNRGVFNAVAMVEAIRAAQEKHGNKPLTGEQVQTGFENLNLSTEKLARLGLEGFMQPFKTSCADHEGMTPVRIQQWNGKQWQFVSDWIEPNRDLIRGLVEESAKKYAAEKKIELRTCS